MAKELYWHCAVFHRAYRSDFPGAKGWGLFLNGLISIVISLSVLGIAFVFDRIAVRVFREKTHDTTCLITVMK